jgi:hypothetical protein
MSEKDKKALDLIRKHKTLSKGDVKEQFKAHEEKKKKYTMDAAKCEKALEAFNEIVDPIVNPTTDEPLCWVRRPTQEELETLIPDEFMKYRNDPNGIPPDAMKGNEDVLFKMMEHLISVPEHTAKEWKKRANLVFQRLFQMHIQQVMEDLGITVRNF